MKILYYSCLISSNLLSEIIRQSEYKNIPTQSIQKFHRLLVDGLNKNVYVKCISSIPFSNKNIDLSHYNFKNNSDKDFSYTSSYNKNPKIRQFLNFVMSFLNTLLLKDSQNYIGIFDYLNLSVSLGGYLACKLRGIKTIVIITDFPDLMVKSSSSKLFTRFKYKWINSFDGYILLSEYMNEIVNKNQKPYLIMEGLVDSEYISSLSPSKEKIVLYAGGLNEKYGIKKLIDAFTSLKNDFELHLYGSGDAVPYIQQMSLLDNRIKYFGSVENKVIVEKIPKCTLLVNPRPSDLVLSRYSFPSKNMEYMLSGTPLLTTRLPSIPKDHYGHVFFIEDESEDGFKMALANIFNLSLDELYIKGVKAQQFVLNNKSNHIQGKRIVDFINENI